MPLGRRHAWVVFVASLGQLIGTGVATLAGIIIPMLNIMTRPELSSGMQGLIGAMDLIGIVFGSVVFGKLIDKFGYIFFFRLCPAIVLAASVIAALVPTIPVLIITLFFIGFGIGGEYSLDSNYISELMPVKWKSLMVGLAKAASAFGNIFVAGICYLLIVHWNRPDAWPHLMWITSIIAAVMIITRIWFYQSPKWLLQHGEIKQAREAAEKFLGVDVTLSPSETSSSPGAQNTTAGNTTPKPTQPFIIQNWKQIILTGIPWACEGLGVYGIGVFLPILVASLGIEHISTTETPILRVASSVDVTFYISCIILPGFLLGLWMIAKNKNICKMQTWGFMICAAALVALLLASLHQWPKWISITAFMIFELFLNFGPHLVTYVLPPKVYPVATRGFGTGIAASIGKIGAVLGVFFIPVLLNFGGTELVLIVSAVIMVLGAVVTAVFARILRLN